jgi:hypothetical protein
VASSEPRGDLQLMSESLQSHDKGAQVERVLGAPVSM